ncbi:hypothetical protein TIFTF001_025326 [Ficus carica]|uniref:AT-hook motif nuclear-localized protein n=1 Tax=Ficus carica TaxID=3494 RepID=A0AA88DE28_FICCA|nr:hypothetical protein TIFTF001_025326 [Ficus carica]
MLVSCTTSFVEGGLAAATAGGSFTPHVIAVQIGEDVICKIVAFTEIRSSRALCILSATGTVSAATLSQSSPSGPFEILSLKGSRVFGSTSGSRQHKIGKLTVLLSKPNGEVFGGAVGSLIAACPIQLILGTFKQNINSQLRRISVEAVMAASAVNSPNLGRVLVQKAPADDDDLTSSFLASTEGEEDNPVAASQHMNHTSLLDVGDENDFLEMPDEKPSLDIKSDYAHFRRFSLSLSTKTVC